MLNTQVAVNELFSQMHMAIKGNPEAQRISDKIEALVRAQVFPTHAVDWQVEYGLTGAMSRIAEMLHKNMGKTVPKGTIYDDMYFDKPDNPPEPKIIDVWVCRMRKLMKDCPFEIETVWGSGYRMKERKAS